jgi:hypothetical protein
VRYYGSLPVDIQKVFQNSEFLQINRLLNFDPVLTVLEALKVDAF